jgi:hypothetical protein
LNVIVGGARERSDGWLAFNSNYARDVTSAAVRAVPSASTRLELSLRGVNDEYHFPTDGAGKVEDRNAFRDTHRFIGSATVSHDMSSRVRAELSLTGMNIRGRDDDRPDTPADTMGFYYYDALTSVRRRAGDARVHVMLSQSSVLTVGGEAVREAQRGNDSSNFSFERSRFVADRRNSAVYTQWLSEYGPVSLTMGPGTTRMTRSVRFARPEPGLRCAPGPVGLSAPVPARRSRRRPSSSRSTPPFRPGTAISTLSGREAGRRACVMSRKEAA